MKKEEFESEFIFKKLQFKSIEKLELFSELLDTIEKEFGVRTGKITLDNCFICPDITDNELNTLNNNQMERNILSIVKQLI